MMTMSTLPATRADVPAGPILRRLLTGCLAVLAVAACAGPGALAPPQIAFPNEALIRLEAEEPVEIVEQYRAPLRRPHVEHEFALVPAQIVETWAQERLDLSGNGGDARLTILDASVTLEPVPVRGGGFWPFRNAVNRRLIARLDVQFDYVGAAGRGASTRAAVELSRPVHEKTKGRDLEAVYFELMTDLAKAFDERMADRIRRAFQAVQTGAA